PPLGEFRRYRVLEFLNFITTELHKRFGFLFNPNATDAFKQFVIADLRKKLDYIDGKLGHGPFLMGEQLTLGDPYLFVIAGWAEKMIGLDQWSNLSAFRGLLTIGARPRRRGDEPVRPHRRPAPDPGDGAQVHRRRDHAECGRVGREAHLSPRHDP